MKLFSGENAYKVVAMLWGGQCMLAEDEQGRRVILLKSEDADALLSYKGNQAFTDFVGTLTYKGCLHAVFAYNREEGDIPLSLALRESPPAMRAFMLKSLLAGLAVQDMPFAVMCGVLTPDNLVCSPSGQVKFIYCLSESCSSVSGAMARLAAVAREICGTMPSDELEGFLRSVEAMRFKSAGEVYAAFAPVYGGLASLGSPPEKPGLMERVRALYGLAGKHAAAIAAVVVLAAGYILLALMLYTTVFSPERADYGITMIGTVEIHGTQGP